MIAATGGIGIVGIIVVVLIVLAIITSSDALESAEPLKYPREKPW